MLAGGSFEYMKQACINEGGVVLVLNDLIHSLKLTAHVCTDMHCSAYDLVKQLIQRNPFRLLTIANIVFILYYVRIYTYAIMLCIYYHCLWPIMSSENLYFLVCIIMPTGTSERIIR